ncbi:MAG: insulinase family protein, partial [Opitutaceae bacterium]
RTRDSVGWRTFVAQYNFGYDGSLFPKRFPIGETDIIQGAQRERFADFYDAWYRPELISIVVVGDIDPAAVEKQIAEAFTPLKARAPARPKPDLGKLNLSAAEGVRVFYHYESEAPSTSVGISTLQPYAHETDNRANRVKYLPRDFAHSIISRRLAILAKKENAPFISGSASASEGFDFYRETSIDLDCRADQWIAALGVADQELRRALEFGFQPAELQEVVANFRNRLEQSVKTAATRRSEGIANEIVGTIIDRNVFTAPDEDLAVYGPAIDKITVADCLAALRAAWTSKHRLVSVTGNAKIEPAEQTIAATFEKSRATPVTAPETIADLKWGYTDFGAPGKIAKREHVGDLDITLVAFENGVRLNLKKTDFEANRIRIGVRLGSGRLTEPRDKRGLATYASMTYSAGALGKHSADDLRRITAGKTVGGGFGVGADAFTINGATNREDLLLEMQLLAAHLTDPGFRAEAARQALKSIEQAYLSFEHTPSGPFNLVVESLLASGDSRFGLPSQEELLKRNLDEVKDWTAADRARGAIEIAIVGDMDIDTTIDAVARTFGALPKRDPKAALAELRQIKFPAEPFARDFSIPTEIPNGVVTLYWSTTDGREIQRARRLQMLARVFEDRLRVKVREELGDAYSPGAISNAGDLYPGYGYLQASVTIDPPRAKQVADIIVAIANDLAEKGVTDEELQRAKQPVLTSLRESARTNGYWLGNVLARAQEKPEVLDWCRSRYADNEAITAAELSALAKSYLGTARASRVIVVPATK